MTLGFAKIMLALPVLGAGLTTLDPDQEFQLFKWALWGALAGGYCSAAGELYRLLTKSAKNWPAEVGLAVLQLSIAIPFGLFFALWMASDGSLHHWRTASVAFLAALVGILVKPVIEKLGKNAVQRGGNALVGMIGKDNPPPENDR